jgi:hypothetical protein
MIIKIIKHTVSCIAMEIKWYLFIILLKKEVKYDIKYDYFNKFVIIIVLKSTIVDKRIIFHLL